MEEGVSPLPYCEDIAAAFQDAVFRHLLQRTQRAMIYCQRTSPEIQNLVMLRGMDDLKCSSSI